MDDIVLPKIDAAWSSQILARLLSDVFSFFRISDLGVSFTIHFRKEITESSVIFLWHVVLILN